jgi:hypothetical protein
MESRQKKWVTTIMPNEIFVDWIVSNTRSSRLGCARGSRTLKGSVSFAGGVAGRKMPFSFVMR